MSEGGARWGGIRGEGKGDGGGWVGGLQSGRGTNDAAFTINYSTQVVIY